MERPGLASAAIALAFLALSAQAQVASLHAREVDLHGEGSLEARVAGAVLLNATASGILHLAVARGELVVKEEARDVSVADVGVTDSEPNETRTPLRNATVDGFALVPNNRLLLVEADALLAGDGVDGASLGDAEPGALTFQQRASLTDPAWRIDRDGALELGRAALGNDTVTGSFLLVVWGASFTVHDEAGDRTVQAGSFDEPLLLSGVPVVRRVQREAVLRVDEGALWVDRALPFQFYLTSCRVDLDRGSLDAREPRGANPVDGKPIGPGGRLLSLKAPLEAEATGAGPGVGLAFPRPPGEADLDGTVIRAREGDTWPLALSLVVLAALPAAAAAASQLRLRRRLRALDGLVAEARSDEALALARRIRRLRPRQPDALVAEALALLQAGRHREAAEVLEAEGWTAALRPVRDYLRATAAAGQGRRGAAARWLERSLEGAPELAREAQANPFLHDLLPSRTREPGGLDGPAGPP